MKALYLNFREGISRRFSFSNPFSQAKLDEVAQKSRYIYMALVFLVVGLGFSFILCFPFFLFYLPVEIYESILHINSVQDWIHPAIASLLFIIAGLVSYELYRLPFSQPKGLEISSTSFPRLIELIDELRNTYHKPRIHRIILGDRFDIQIVKTPRLGLPIFTTNTLVIGLPVLLTTSPLYFRILLARRIGQTSAKHNRISNLVFNLARIWPQYRYSAQRRGNPVAKLLSFLFKIYSKIFATCMQPLLRKDELEADHYALEIVNDNDMVECLIYTEVVEQFLNKKYWPKLKQLARRNDQVSTQSFTHLSRVIKSSINKEEVRSAIQAAMSPDIKLTSFPPLTARLNQLGHYKPLPPKLLQKSAAEFYLGSTLQKIVTLFDKQWYKKQAKG